MYQDFYHMKSEPFGMLPVPDIFYASETHQSAWNYLAEGTKSSQSPLLVTGLHGTGKTLLCLKLVAQLTQRAHPRFVYSPVPTFDYRFILKDMALRLDIPVFNEDEAVIQYGIYNYFREQKDKTCVYLIFDDAQAIDSATLTKIFYFANFNYQSFFPFRLALFGRTSLCEKLASLQLDALMHCQQRSCFLQPLNRAEIREYMYYRLLVSDAPGVPSFTDDAIEDIFAHSRGIPLLVNALCTACLRLGAQRGMTVIDRALVFEAHSSGLRGASIKTPAETAAPEIKEPCPAPAAAAAPSRRSDDTEGGSNNIPQPPVRKTFMLRNILLAIIAAALVGNLFILYALLKRSGPDTSISDRTKTVPIERSTTIFNQSSTTTIEPEQEKADTTDRSTAAPIQRTTTTEEPFRETEEPIDRGTTELNQSSTTTEELESETEDTADTKDGMREETSSIASSTAAMTVSPSASTVSTTVTLPIQPITTIPSVARSAARFPYTLQLACYISEEGAKEKARSYKRFGLSPFIVKNFSRKTGAPLWVIYSGYYRTAEDAGRDIKKYQLFEALSSRTPYAVLIGTFASAEDMAGIMTRLEQLKYSFYTIPEGASVMSLFAGAFTTRTGAEQLKLQLQEDGITSQVVLR
jgi:type II secretory pathway predicted ATPase ExeA/cell division protein FtsN